MSQLHELLRRLLVFCCVLSLSVSSNVGSWAASPTPRAVHFANDVVPILTKAGCNSGACHAKAGGGQNGFALSLLGFEPQEDFEHLVLEGRGRRLSPAAPERSLLLRKATAELPHGGGQRIAPNSPEYVMLRTWIEQGMPYADAADTRVERFEVEPASGKVAMGGQQQLRAVAHFSDGSSRDVTHLALFESNNRAMAEVDEAGLVQIGELPGTVAIMVRFQDKVAVYSGLIPLAADVGTAWQAANLPPVKNFIDEGIFATLQQIGLPPSERCDDATFLRRVSLDIAGRLPTVEESQAYFATPADARREQWVETLLRSPSYADYFANKWTTLLKNRRENASDITSNFAFHSWIRDSLLANKPYDQWVRELLAATGTIIGNPPVAWYKRVKEPTQQIEDVAQLFLGVRMQCAQCHHHPFERWSQDDYYGFVAFFSRIGRKPTGTRGEDLIFHQRGLARAKNVRSGEMLVPSALGDAMPSITADEDPRLHLADWMADKENPYFAKAVVNRYWKHFFKRGLIEPEDDIRDSNPPCNPQVLAALEQHFINSGFDLQELVRVLVNSSTYQLSSLPNEYNAADVQNYSHFYPKRMQAEVLLDAIDDITGATTSFANLPPGTRAIALPDNSYNTSTPFLAVFGRPDNSSVCECERVQSSSLGQSLHMLNSSDIKSKLAVAGGRADRLAKDERPAAEKIREIYLAAFSREPTADELQAATAYVAEPRVDAAGKPLDAVRALKENYEDLIWALISTKEFLFNH
ncbi:MAG: DUF1553 domain-containing protein [Planctomycetales bacterium]|nr:DUF1553 domain-containing protein [Planctomycetales bacterium]